MFIYSQATGRLWCDKGELVAVGYSGFGVGKNNPECQHIVDVGPIPRGLYGMGSAYNSSNVGPLSLPLNPIDHNAFGRTAFVIHGDSTTRPGAASKGCIILARDVRKLIAGSGDNFLKVIE
ncbi:tlde1 domain-containing protein [Marinagarivorans algicola]|uniref:tlde1 domain-containing protein n=1 Tax=Marinagarivorans algicola TaxID=1513270 RepID=UPI0037369EBA